MDKFSEDIVQKIKNGGVGVIPTDTMYGIVASAMNSGAVDKIYKLKYRDEKKRLIVLISSLDDLKLLNINLDNDFKSVIDLLWPGPFSIDIPFSNNDFPYLTRGLGSVAFRFPKDEILQNFISKTGPIVAPSANTEGEPPAETIYDAKEYFPDLDFYVDGGVLKNNPSTVISIIDNKVKIWRQGQGILPIGMDQI